MQTTPLARHRVGKIYLVSTVAHDTGLVETIALTCYFGRIDWENPVALIFSDTTEEGLQRHKALCRKLQKSLCREKPAFREITEIAA